MGTEPLGREERKVWAAMVVGGLQTRDHALGDLLHGRRFERRAPEIPVRFDPAEDCRGLFDGGAVIAQPVPFPNQRCADAERFERALHAGKREHRQEESL